MKGAKKKIIPRDVKGFPPIPETRQTIWNRYRLWIFLFWLLGVIAILMRWGNF